MDKILRVSMWEKHTMSNEQTGRMTQMDKEVQLPVEPSIRHNQELIWLPIVIRILREILEVERARCT